MPVPPAKRGKPQKLPRKLSEDDSGCRRRLEYVREYLFNDDTRAFAQAVQMETFHLSRVIDGRIRLTGRVIVQILAHTRLRPDWLLFGSGSMFLNGQPEASVLVLPETLQSSFPVFDTLNSEPAFLPVPEPTPEIPGNFSAAHVAAARAIYSARVANQPVMFFFSAPAIIAGAGVLAVELLRKKYVTSVALTGAALHADVAMARQQTPADLNYIARLGATTGMGYGEAIGRYAFAPKDNKTRSVFYAAYVLGLPATVHVEIGEVSQHLRPSARGAELGAAIGAVTYTDMLIFTEQVQQMTGDPAGVLLLAGDAMRGLNLFLQARAAGTAKPFAAVLLDNNNQPNFQETVRGHGGQEYIVSGTYRANVSNLIDACDAVFNGTISHEFKQP
jgi:hypothetical protein